MVEIAGSKANRAPTTVAQLSLPPTFVVDHCLRTLFYQGPLSPVELARHWHVHADVGFEVVERLKAEGVVQTEGINTNFERHGKVDLTALGRERVATARERTWYAGAMPVAAAEFRREMETSRRQGPTRGAIRAALARHYLDDRITDEIGQAIAGEGLVSVFGLTAAEQAAIAAAIGGAMEGEVLLPHALYAAGAVIRLVDGRHHQARRQDADSEDENILRTSEEEQWARIARPIVTVKGGLVASELLPAYDDEARFYIAPAPLAACGGMLAVLHGDISDADALVALARLWLIPGRSRSGVLCLRSGERVELPWNASTLLLSTAPVAFPVAIADALGVYTINASVLEPGSLPGFLADRLRVVAMPDALLQLAVERFEREAVSTRLVAAAFADYVRGRAEFERDDFRPTTDLIEEAIDFARSSPQHPDASLRLVA